MCDIDAMHLGLDSRERERDESGEGRFESRRESNAKEKDPPGGGGE